MKAFGAGRVFGQQGQRLDRPAQLLDARRQLLIGARTCGKLLELSPEAPSSSATSRPGSAAASSSIRWASVSAVSGSPAGRAASWSMLSRSAAISSADRRRLARGRSLHARGKHRSSPMTSSSDSRATVSSTRAASSCERHPQLPRLVDGCGKAGECLSWRQTGERGLDLVGSPHGRLKLGQESGVDLDGRPWRPRRQPGRPARFRAGRPPRAMPPSRP